MAFELVLVSIEPGLAKAWTTYCGHLPDVDVVRGDILDVDCDALVSPANSFGFMDGGIDGLYLEHFGPAIQAAVRRQISDHHGGELLVGDADIVSTGDHSIPYLIAAPTMRVPMKLRDSVHPYLAARAVFRLVTSGTFTGSQHNGRAVSEVVKRVAMPGLGTGVGGIGANNCARQVAAAYADIVLDAFEMPTSWAEASERHHRLVTDDPTELQ